MSSDLNAAGGKDSSNLLLSAQAALRIRSSRMTRKGLARTFEVFHEPPLEFDGYQFPHAKMPGAKESYPD